LAGFGKLVNEGNSFEGKKIKLGRNIVLNDIANMENWENAPPKNVWTPIGTNNNAFRGTFDGDGHVISGVYINNPTSDNRGLFGCIETDGPGWQIRNLWVIAFIMGKTSIGGLTGQNRGYIVKSHSAIILMGRTDIGGLVGTHQGASKIFRSRSVGVVKTSGEPRKGELVGNPNTSEKPLCLCECSNGIVIYKPNDTILIKMSKFEKDLFHQLCKRHNWLPHRSSKIWSHHYHGIIDVQIKDNCIVIDDLLRNANVKIYDKNSRSIIYSGNSETSCTLKIPVPAGGIYAVEVNKKRYFYNIKVE